MLKIGVIGGDLRNVYLANSMSKKYKVTTFGLDESKELLAEIEREEDVLTFIEKVDVIVGPIPFEKNGHVTMPYKPYELTAEEFLDKTKEKTVILGGIRKELLSSNIVDLTSNEEFTIKNAVSTVEGVIQIILNNMKKNIDGSNILVLGYGRIGKVAQNKLTQLGAKVCATYRKNTEKAWIEVNGAKSLILSGLKRELEKFSYDIIVNTIPYMVLDQEELELLDKQTLIIDVASAPGGVNKNIANIKGIKVIHELGIPGKKSPITSAKIIEEIIEKEMEMR